MAEHGITGTWRGHYTYKSMPDEGSGFDAIMSEHKGVLKGSIRDDGGLGEASLTGTFSFPSVAFTKVYFNTTLLPIRYEGTMSSDGKTITGRWIISSEAVETRGTWMMHRLDKEEKKSEKQEERQTTDLEQVR